MAAAVVVVAGSEAAVDSVAVAAVAEAADSAVEAEALASTAAVAISALAGAARFARIEPYVWEIIPTIHPE